MAYGYKKNRYGRKKLSRRKTGKRHGTKTVITKYRW